MPHATLVTASNGLATLPYTPGSAKSAGDIVALGNGLLGVCVNDIAANVQGAVYIEGEFKSAKPTGALAIDQPLYWDSGASEIQNDYDGGTNDPAGWVTRAAASGDASVYWRLDSAGLRAAHKTFQHHVADPAAGADLAATLMGAAPPDGAEIVSADISLHGAIAGIDDANTCVVAIKDAAGNTIVSKTYNTGTQPTASAKNNLGALSATHKVLTAGEGVTGEVTNGATANLPAYSLIVTYVAK